jgi:L-ribulose-5-phosphate 4-epimerase
VIIETLKRKKLDPLCMPAVLVAFHGPFAWGTDCLGAVRSAAVLEKLAETAFKSVLIHGAMSLMPPDKMPKAMLDRHFGARRG